MELKAFANILNYTARTFSAGLRLFESRFHRIVYKLIPFLCSLVLFRLYETLNLNPKKQKVKY